MDDDWNAITIPSVIAMAEMFINIGFCGASHYYVTNAMVHFKRPYYKLVLPAGTFVFVAHLGVLATSVLMAVGVMLAEPLFYFPWLMMVGTKLWSFILIATEVAVFEEDKRKMRFFWGGLPYTLLIVVFWILIFPYFIDAWRDLDNDDD